MTWRVLTPFALTPLLTAAKPPASLPGTPDLAATGQVLASVNDWRAFLIATWVLIAFLIALIIWDRLQMRGQTKAIDKLARAVFAFRIALAYRETKTVDIEAIEQELE